MIGRIIASAGLAALLAASGCSRPVVDLKNAPTIVMVSEPIERNVTDYATFISRTAAIDSVELRARVTGYLDATNYTEGAIVKKGEILFKIDPRPYEALVESAEGAVAAAQAALKRAKADNARNKGLAQRSPGAVTAADLDQFQAAEDQAIANLEIAKATLETNQLNLDFTDVKSPINGRAGRYEATVGNLVRQDQTLLTTIVSVDPIYAYFDVDENTLLFVRKLISEGKVRSARDTTVTVALGLANETGFPHEGTINFVDNQVNPKTGTLRLRGVFPNKGELLTPGLFARVRVPIGGRHEALLISDRATDSDQGNKIVYIVNDKNEVLSRTVKLGGQHGKLRAVLEGLKPNDRVIVNGMQLVRPGIVVEPKLVPMPGADSESDSDSPGAWPAGDSPDRHSSDRGSSDRDSSDRGLSDRDASNREPPARQPELRPATPAKSK